ncbi:hypothetical protein AB0Y04_03555 [Loigolactobacillus coryniformis]|uniref:hypothetical protein n=1 Tax=Loigolactobacillus coryniformis TaxID=1610 RepID=UPI000303810D|nr:hypothetical protein [Loigolactobacillus coryniformis]MBW4803453.1 hypothetical protein [Loigolactobacillus coryniformis subsp. torquens]MBW4806149.1 hypothetical protein [Loigolactobacillus coryniformis subsp. torquens]MDT3390949.1 hypothetical protein [Bacillota bacterium]
MSVSLGDYNHLFEANFRREFGVHRTTFDQMCPIVAEDYRHVHQRVVAKVA